VPQPEVAYWRCCADRLKVQGIDLEPLLKQRLAVVIPKAAPLSRCSISFVNRASVAEVGRWDVV